MTIVGELECIASCFQTLLRNLVYLAAGCVALRYTHTRVPFANRLPTRMVTHAQVRLLCVYF